MWFWESLVAHNAVFVKTAEKHRSQEGLDRRKYFVLSRSRHGPLLFYLASWDSLPNRCLYWSQFCALTWDSVFFFKSGIIQSQLKYFLHLTTPRLDFSHCQRLCRHIITLAHRVLNDLLQRWSAGTLAALHLWYVYWWLKAACCFSVPSVPKVKDKREYRLTMMCHSPPPLSLCRTSGLCCSAFGVFISYREGPAESSPALTCSTSSILLCCDIANRCITVRSLGKARLYM